MPRGPKPEPAAVRRAKGNPGKRRIGEPPAADAAIVEGVAPPAWLDRDGLAVWKELAPRVARQKLLTPTDAHTFGRYCANFADWLRYRAVLLEKGDTYSVTTASGLVIRARPEFLMADRKERQLMAAEDRFGLNPAERQRIFAARASSPQPGELPFGEGQRPPPSPAPDTPKRSVGYLN